MPSTAVAAVYWLGCTLVVAAAKLLLRAVNQRRLRLLAALSQLPAAARSALVFWLVFALVCTAARVPLRPQAAVNPLRHRLAKLRHRLAAKLRLPAADAKLPPLLAVAVKPRPPAAVAKLPQLPAAVIVV
jgi:hypothetical protein